MTKKIGILGGAFNPIHIGHIEIANAVLAELHYNEIWFLVSFNPPHKKLLDYNNFKHRCNMVKLAICNNDKFKLLDIEYELYKNNTFEMNSSYNVMLYITSKYPNYSFSNIIGFDSILNIKTWINYRELLNQFHFIIVKREEYDYDTIFLNNLVSEYNLKYILLKNNISNCSSTDIKNELKDKGNSKYLEKKVLEYIKQNNLYKE